MKGLEGQRERVNDLIILISQNPEILKEKTNKTLIGSLSYFSTPVMKYQDQDHL